ncbi:hypothetical protein [Noviherbaspirillum suwonense]|uniref:Chemotaxis protein n=1 Tax=Noviherbaspirillum suwonense TaxID=1224511 RepID=A0ABY1QHY9_9BURK|nr:hypothetical protein [Noviherbaspirillum suwonense]SMP72026.1 hypothetical protein SAMN06295970_117113 [Noviherbaspirillum suwonense]
MATPWIENLLGSLGMAGGGALAIKWVVEAWREERAKSRGAHAESQAIKHLSAEVDRMAKRMDELEKDVAEKSAANAALQSEIDEQRRLRRLAEDKFDAECRARQDLEKRVAELEKKS